MRWLTTRDTVDRLTPAAAATDFSVGWDLGAPDDDSVPPGAAMGATLGHGYVAARS